MPRPQDQSPAEEASDLDPVIAAYMKDVDRTLLVRNLQLTPQERLIQLIELQRFAGELRRAGRVATRSP